MKLDPKPTPAKCDRCGKTTTKYVETQDQKGIANKEVQAIAYLAAHLGLQDVCLSCWSIIQSCVTRAGKVQARKRVEK